MLDETPTAETRRMAALVREMARLNRIMAACCMVSVVGGCVIASLPLEGETRAGLYVLGCLVYLGLTIYENPPRTPRTND